MAIRRRSDGLDGLSSRRNTIAPDDGDSVSSGSMSADLGEMWRYGCPKSPDWDGDVELDSVDQEDRESVEDRLLQAIESPLWALVRDFLTSDDVLHMRTTAVAVAVEVWVFGLYSDGPSLCDVV